MAGSKSNYLENKLLDGVLGGPAFSLPANVYIALSTAAYTDAATGSAMDEVSSVSTGYARATVANNATNWPPAVNGSKANGDNIGFAVASGTWGTVLAFYICDAASGGNVLYGGDLASPRTVNAGDTAAFAAGALTITED